MKVNDLTIKWLYRHVPIVTYCDIYVGETLIATGQARCNPKDHFNKDGGRKLSLSRALQEIGLSKEDKKCVWEVYRTMTKKPRWGK